MGDMSHISSNWFREHNQRMFYLKTGSTPQPGSIVKGSQSIKTIQIIIIWENDKMAKRNWLGWIVWKIKKIIFKSNKK